MKTIVTFEDNQGYFSEVGMNNRYISHLKTIKGIVKEAHRSIYAHPGRRFTITTWSGTKIYEGVISQ